MIKKSYIIIASSAVLILGWILLIVPYLTKIPSDFSYTADIFSVDNFYDEEKGVFAGSEVSNTDFLYEVTREDKGILTIKNTFDVRTDKDELIFSTQREYGVDAFTGAHVAGYGDKDRTGYLFGPKEVKKDYFAFWHVSFDMPATMKFYSEEVINGLTLYHFIADYQADTTNDLHHLPGVPEVRGVNLDVNLHLWIEPVTGHMIKFQDRATAYYYDMETQERLHPWNKFSNRYSSISVNEHISAARREKNIFQLYNWWIPIMMVMMTTLAVWIQCQKDRKNLNISS